MTDNGTEVPLIGSRLATFAAFYLLALLIVAAVVAFGGLEGATGALRGLIDWYGELGGYPNTLSIAAYALQDPRILLVFVFAGAPTFAALTSAWWKTGADGVRSVVRRLHPTNGAPMASEIGHSAARVYVVLAVVYLWGSLAYLGFAWWGGVSDGWRMVSRSLGGTVAVGTIWLLIGPWIDEGGLWEELGWRGFALPLLLDSGWSPLRASVLLATLWWFWHVPREVPLLLGGVDVRVWLRGQLVFLLLCVALSILMTWTFHLTGGSALPALLIHGFTNVWSKALAGPTYLGLGIDVRTWLVVLAAVAAVLVTRGRLGATTRSSRLMSA